MAGQVVGQAVGQALEAPYGPWSRLIAARWGAYPLTIYQNPERALLVTLFDVEGEAIKGLVVLMRRALICEGEAAQLQRFMREQQEATLIEKSFKGEYRAFVLLASTPHYISYSLEELDAEIKKQYDELEARIAAAIESAPSYRLRARELREASDEEVETLLGDPYVLLAFLNPAIAKPLPEAPRLVLGKSASGEMTGFKASSASRVHVVSGVQQRRLHALHAFAEAAVDAGLPCIIVDGSGAFAKLSEVGARREDLAVYGLKPFTPEVVDYKIGKNFFLDLSLVNANDFLSVFGLKGSDVAGLIATVFEKQRELSTINDLVRAVSAIEEGVTFTRYLIEKARRACEAIGKLGEGMFGKWATPELLDFTKRNAKIYHLDLSNAPEPVKFLAVALLLQRVLHAGREPRGFLIFEMDAGILPNELVNAAAKLSSEGVGVALQSETDLPFYAPLLRIEIVGEEAIVTEVGGRPTRIAFRPCATACGELLVSKA